MPGGRPSTYNAEIADELCEVLATTSLGLRRICNEIPDMPAERVVYAWLDKHPEFQQKYARARERQADGLADETYTIPDTDPDPQRARVRMDARKWAASKLAPKKYGDKLELGGANGGPLVVQVVEYVMAKKGEGDAQS